MRNKVNLLTSELPAEKYSESLKRDFELNSK